MPSSAKEKADQLVAFSDDWKSRDSLVTFSNHYEDISTASNNSANVDGFFSFVAPSLVSPRVKMICSSVILRHCRKRFMVAFSNDWKMHASLVTFSNRYEDISTASNNSADIDSFFSSVAPSLVSLRVKMICSSMFPNKALGPDGKNLGSTNTFGM
uniref:Uncharacterized protein n=1 Tax=Ipomoea trifida TaxID=35884 RepID=A0PAB7_IPOTF|nr:hypothetical protein [Ipomoea trifida]